MTEYATDLTATVGRIEELQKYFDKSVLRNGQFICSSKDECKGSHPGTFCEGQLPHVGTHYDLTRNGAPFRIVVVGQEYGHPPNHVDIIARRRMIVDTFGTSRRFRAENGFRARNPHMKGCTSLLRLLFGKDLGSDYEGESVELGGTRIHIFDCFALVNFLLCSALPRGSICSDELILRGGKRGEATRIMQRHCARHFGATLERLEPTIIVVQRARCPQMDESSF